MLRVGPIALLLAVGSALLVGGCAARIGDYEAVTRVSPERSMLRFDAAVFAGAAVERAAYYDVWQYEEFARVRAAGFMLEMVYATAAGDDTAIQYPFSLNRMTAIWRHNAGTPIAWGPDHRVRSPIVDIWYRRYTLPARGESCAAFDAEWDLHMYDTLARPTEALFGYLCAAPGARLDDAAIDAIISGIAIRGVSERIRAGEPKRLGIDAGRPVAPSPGERAAALALARGDAGAATGNPNFPFRLAVLIDPEDGHLRFRGGVGGWFRTGIPY